MTYHSRPRSYATLAKHVTGKTLEPTESITGTPHGTFRALSAFAFSPLNNNKYRTGEPGEEGKPLDQQAKQIASKYAIPSHPLPANITLKSPEK